MHDYDSLYRVLTEQPEVRRPELGRIRTLPPIAPPQSKSANVDVNNNLTICSTKDIGQNFPFRTHGGKRVAFDYWTTEQTLTISNENNNFHHFPLTEVHSILNALYEQFGMGWFPLANNVQKMGEGTEQPGLGCTILREKPGDITHAQGASYLGCVLEHAGIMKWNNKKKGIKWRLLESPSNPDRLNMRLARKKGQ